LELILDDLRGGYVNLVKHVAHSGTPVTSRGLATRELTAVSLIFPNVLNPLLPVGVGRGVNARLAAIEALQLISGIQRHDLIQVVTPGFESVLVDQDNPDYGAYGPRIIEQVGDCVDILHTDSTTRRAVITIWNEKDLTHHGDRPCTVFLQFLVRDNGFGPALELHSYMRSQDVWLGVPYDIFMFSQLQHTVAFILGLPVGQLAHHVTSLHIYETDLSKVDALYEPSDVVDLKAVSTVTGLELPLGVQCSRTPAPDRDPAGPLDLHVLDVASYLLEDSADEDERARNPWYDEIMAHVHAKADEVNAVAAIHPATFSAASR
jgi:thymidylate synthase